MASHFSFCSRVLALVRRGIGITPNVPPLDDGRGTKPDDKRLLAAGPFSFHPTNVRDGVIVGAALVDDPDGFMVIVLPRQEGFAQEWPQEGSLNR